jgi:hypothetical protein
LSLQWEPKWEETEIEVDGVKLKVPRDASTKLYACPICGLSEGSSYFFSERDLVYHIISHVTRRHVAPASSILPEESEEEEEELDEV